jgi:hypothetical protein
VNPVAALVVFEDRRQPRSAIVSIVSGNSLTYSKVTTQRSTSVGKETVKLRKPSAPEPLKLLKARARDVVKVAALEAVFLPGQDGRASVLAST